MGTEIDQAFGELIQARDEASARSRDLERKYNDAKLIVDEVIEESEDNEYDYFSQLEEFVDMFPDYGAYAKYLELQGYQVWDLDLIENSRRKWLESSEVC